MKTHQVLLLLVITGFFCGCATNLTTPRTTIDPNQYLQQRAEYKAFLRDHISADYARHAVLDALRSSKSIDGIVVPEEKVFTSWNLHLESPDLTIEADDWIVATSESGEALQGLVFSLGFDRKTKRFERYGPWMVNLHFRIQTEAGGVSLVFERADVYDERNLILTP